jgi:hypothetical protein
MGYMAIRDCDAATSVSGPCDGLVMGLRDGRGALIVVVFIRAALSDSIVRADVRAPLAPARIGAPTPRTSARTNTHDGARVRRWGGSVPEGPSRLTVDDRELQGPNEGGSKGRREFSLPGSLPLPPRPGLHQHRTGMQFPVLP